MALLLETEVHFIDELLDDKTPKMTLKERILYEFEQIIKTPELCSHGFGDTLPPSVIDIISHEGKTKMLCKYCKAGKNLVVSDDILTETFCGSCRAKLSRTFCCSRCKGPCWVNELGLAAKLCKFCHPIRTPVTISFRTGDWVCPICFNHNYAVRDVCNYCQISKSVKTKTTIKREDWSCSCCGYINFARRPLCGKCGFKRSIIVI